jgi:hypothetical protein
MSRTLARPTPPMKRLQRLLPAALLATLLGAQADPTYRIVSPDGKITYSDRKPTDPQVRARALGQTVTAPLLAPAAAPFDLRPATTAPSIARPASGDAPPVDVSGKPFPPGLPEAVLDVLVHQFFVQTLVETCDRVRPGLGERYRMSVFNWRERNAEILAKSNRISFTRFTGEQRDALRSTSRSRLEALLPPPESAPEAKVQWCEKMATDLARRQFELVGDMRVAPILYAETP